MTSRFTKIYPDKQNGRVTLDGGLSSRYPRTLIMDNETPDCLNVQFNSGGAETRGGTTKFNTTAIGSFVFDGLYTRKARDDSQTMIAFAGGSAWELLTTTFTTISSAQSIFTAGQRVAATNYENQLFCGNGSIIPHRWTGADFVRHGVYPPATTHTAATNGAGTLTGGYRHKVTWVNSNLAESDLGPANATITVASQGILVSSIPVAPQSYGIGYRNIYRTLTNGSIWYYAGQIANNTATTFADNLSDSQLGVTAPVDNGVPPLYGNVVQFQDRLFTDDPSNRNYLWYSELGEPYTFKTTNFETVGDASGDLNRTITPYNNGIIVEGDVSITFIYMPDTDPTNWVKVVLDSSYGSKSPFGLALYNNVLFFPAVLKGKFQGIGALLGQTLAPSAEFLTTSKVGGNLTSTKIQDHMDLIQNAYIRNISAITFNDTIYFSVTSGSGNTTNNKIFILDFKNDDLSKVQKFSFAPWDGINAAQFTVYNNLLYYGSSTANGFVYLMNTSTSNDDGAAINSYYKTKEFDGYKEDINLSKDFRFLNMLVDLSGTYYMDVNVIADSDSGSGDLYTVDLTPTFSTWGFMWGNSVWGGGVDQKDVKLFLGSIRGKRIQFKFSNQNTVNQKFKVHWLRYAYNPKGYRG